MILKASVILTLFVVTTSQRAYPAVYRSRLRHGAAPHVAPYMAYLIMEYTQQATTVRHKFCNGVLVSKNYILTAAACLAPLQYPIVTAVLGAQNLSNHEPNQLFVHILQHIIHEGYENNKYLRGYDDIALLKLARPIETNEYIQPIKLPSFDDAHTNHTNDRARVFSWYTPVGNKFASLQQIDEIVQDYGQCAKCKCGTPEICTPKHLCAKPTGSRRCPYKYYGELSHGDVGAPLVADDNGDEVLIGISLFTRFYSPPRDEFTSVSQYLDWIKNNSDVETLAGRPTYTTTSTSSTGMELSTTPAATESSTSSERTKASTPSLTG